MLPHFLRRVPGHHGGELLHIRLTDGADGAKMPPQLRLPLFSHAGNAVQGGAEGGLGVALMMEGDGKAVGLLLDLADEGKDLKDYTYYYTCGPKNMLKAVYDTATTDGELSFEEKMGCGFGACMGCTCETTKGNKRICKEGPVLKKEEIYWELRQTSMDKIAGRAKIIIVF